MNMMHLINLILDSRKLEEGYEHIDLAPHDLNLWLGSVTDEFRKEYESKDISLRFEPDPKIQSVNYDSSKFHIILSNLLMNAWKFSEPHTEVTVRTSAVEGMVRISVIDQGIGIKQSEIPFLFNRFTKEDMKSSGFGLGLSYVKALVEAHPGGGSEPRPTGTRERFSGSRYRNTYRAATVKFPGAILSAIMATIRRRKSGRRMTKPMK